MEILPFLQYLAYEKRFSQHTCVAYRSDLEQCCAYLKEAHGIEGVAHVSHRHIRAWMAQLLKEGRSARTIRRKLSAVQSFFAYELLRGNVLQNPAKRLQAPKPARKLPVAVSSAELAGLFARLPAIVPNDFSACRDRLLLEILYGCGLRRSEVVALRMQDVDVQQQRLRVEGKGGKTRLIPFGPTLKEALQCYLLAKIDIFPDNQSDCLLLTDKGRPIYDKWVYLTTKAYLVQLPTAEQYSPHVLRHSFATHLVENGAELNAVKTLLGHSSLAATQIYTHNALKHLKNVYRQAHPKAKPQDKE
jgi:integrase/recombinase XerC